jgi:hypothetical protein
VSRNLKTGLFKQPFLDDPTGKVDTTDIPCFGSPKTVAMKPDCEFRKEIDPTAARATHASGLGRRHWLARIVIGVAIVGAGGCRICKDCEDMAYPAYGGAWTRTKRDSGRVASLFDPAGAKNSVLAGRDMPQEEDEQERSQRDGKSLTDPAEDDEEAKQDKEGKTEEKPKKDRPKIEDFKEQDLDDIEDEKSNKLKDLELDDIEVRKMLEKQKQEQERAKKIF